MTLALASWSPARAYAQSANDITAVSPSSGAQGTNGLTITFTLDADAPPAPPAGVLPTSAMIGAIGGTALSHPSQYTVTAVFNVPAGEPVGARDVTVVFPLPNPPGATLTFSKAGGFTVTAVAGAAPFITGQPASRTVRPGSTVVFTVAASGTAPLDYQWRKGLAPLAGGTNASFTIPSAAEGDAGGYRCLVANALGSATSDVAVLTVDAGALSDYTIVDTAQESCYDTKGAIAAPAPGGAFGGQDAQYAGHPPSYAISGDGLTVADHNTGLTWQQSPDTDGDGGIDSDDKKRWADLPAYVAALNAARFGGFDDWRIPSIKELYSLMDFRGTDPSGYSGTDPSGIVPFVDTNYFAFGFGDTDVGERLIDAQYWSSTEYVSTTMGGDATVFGVNFADGRIKGYPRDTGPGGSPFTEYVRCVRGHTSYGANDFSDNGDGTITDRSTGLMWQRGDSGAGLNWEDALAYAENLELGGYRDWRLPNAKELQGIVDYTRSPATSASAAIDPIFACASVTNEGGAPDYPFYWTATTHASWATPPGRWAAYVCFGRALGYMNGSWLDVHGAGAQRSDPKYDDGTDYSTGHGPQGDAVRITNYVRCVRAGAAGPAVDTDGDGLTDWYEWNYAANATNMVPAEDDDGDGSSNGDEEAAGTIPTDPDSVLCIDASASVTSAVVLSWPSELGRTYRLERSTNMAADAFSATVASGIPAATPVNTQADTPPHLPAFYRVAVE